MDKTDSSKTNRPYMIRYSPLVGTDCCCFQVPSTGVTPACLEDIHGNPPSRRCLPPASCESRTKLSVAHISALRARPPARFSHRSRLLRPEGELPVRLFERADRIWPATLGFRECARARTHPTDQRFKQDRIFTGYRGVPSSGINRSRGKSGRQESEREDWLRVPSKIFSSRPLLCPFVRVADD